MGVSDVAVKTTGYRDQVDRSVVVQEALRRTSRTCLRALVVVASVYVAWIVLRMVWQGVLPVILAIIVCTVLAGPTSWLRRAHFPSALAAATTLIGFLLWSAG